MIDHIGQRATQRSAVGIEESDMIEPGMTFGRRGSATAFPRVQADVVVIAAGREKRGLIAIVLHYIQPYHIAIERDCAI